MCPYTFLRESCTRDREPWNKVNGDKPEGAHKEMNKRGFKIFYYYSGGLPRRGLQLGNIGFCVTGILAEQIGDCLLACPSR